MATQLVGRRFGRLMVVGLGAKRGVKRRWHCRCDCGGESLVHTTSLTSGATVSCGCFKRERASASLRRIATTHGMKRTPTWRSWSAMRTRCRNPNATGYERYGGAGISIAPEWDSFERFLADMGPRPEGKTLDRWPDKHGDYGPGNCRWATPLEQRHNWRGVDDDATLAL